MMKIFKSQKARPAFLRGIFQKTEIFVNSKFLRLAQHINRKLQTIRRRSLSIGFIIAGCVWFFACWYVAIASFKTPDSKLSIKAIHVPTVQEKRKDSIDDKRLKIALKHIVLLKEHLDRLQLRKPEEYNRLMVGRPGLQDSIRLIERLYRGIQEP